MKTLENMMTVRVPHLPDWVKPGIAMHLTAAVHHWMVGEEPCQNRPAEIDDKVTDFVAECIRRTLTGDWGDLCPEDRKQNDEATQPDGGRIMAAYNIPDDLTTYGARDSYGRTQDKVWVIVEYSKDILTVLFPGDY